MKTGVAIGEFLENKALKRYNEQRKMLNEARKEGYHAIIRNNKLIVNGQEYIEKENKNEETRINETAEINARCSPKITHLETPTPSKKGPIQNAPNPKNHRFRNQI